MIFRWAWDDLGDRKDNCIVSESQNPKASRNLKKILTEFPKIQSMIDNPTDLEEFLRTLGGGYHNGGHNAMAAGMYWCCLLKHEQ